MTQLTRSRSQRVLGETQWGSQWNQQESQFMRATGNLVSHAALYSCGDICRANVRRKEETTTP